MISHHHRVDSNVDPDLRLVPAYQIRKAKTEIVDSGGGGFKGSLPLLDPELQVKLVDKAS
jgi:hypothetical protein